MRYASLLLFVLTSTIYADDPFGCVDSDIADAFLWKWQEEPPEYSTFIPDGFVQLDVPAGFSLVGSEVSDSRATVVYKTAMDALRATDKAVDALARAGWSENADHGHSMSGGFQSRTRTDSRTLCNDDEMDAMSVAAREASGQTYVSYTQFFGLQSCHRGRAPHHGLMARMPVLHFPDSVEASRRGMGGSGGEVNSRATISGAITRTQLQGHFEDQIRMQDWEYQAKWSGDLSSGSVWSLNTEDAGLLIGTLHLFDSGVEPIQVRFSINSADSAKGRHRGN